MMDNTDLKEKSSYISNKVGIPNFSSKNIISQESYDSRKLEKELENDAKRNEHNRYESLKDIKNEVIKTIFKYLLPFILVLMTIWAMCCLFNANEIKSGVEWLLTTIISLFVGTLIGKFI